MWPENIEKNKVVLCSVHKVGGPRKKESEEYNAILFRLCNVNIRHDHMR